jgi:hypothetical protein
MCVIYDARCSYGIEPAEDGWDAGVKVADM